MSKLRDDRLIQQFVGDVRRRDLESWIAEWRDRTEQRTYESNVVEVTVNFRLGWVEIADVLSADHTIRLASIESALDLLGPSVGSV
ncbi:MAG: hypothetical protein U0Q03_00140 [Acidimicrobiales bacterium]